VIIFSAQLAVPMHFVSKSPSFSRRNYFKAYNIGPLFQEDSAGRHPDGLEAGPVHGPRVLHRLLPGLLRSLQAGEAGQKFCIHFDKKNQVGTHFLIWGQCYDHYFCEFGQFSAKKLAFFLNANVRMIFVYQRT
jgi:hypothetical protein